MSTPSLPPLADFAEPITKTLPGGIPNMQLSDPPFAQAQCERGVVIETNMVRLILAPPFST